MLLTPMANKTVIAASVAVFRSVNLIYKTFYIISVIFLNLFDCTQDFNTQKNVSHKYLQIVVRTIL